MTTDIDWSALTDEQLMDAWTPMIFVPSDMPKLRGFVLDRNAAIEAELNRRGIHREEG
jgi:hypothetical protein